MLQPHTSNPPLLNAYQFWQDLMGVKYHFVLIY